MGLTKFLPPRSAWTVGLGLGLAFGDWGALPFIIGAVIEGGNLRADTAGLLGTVELTVMSLSILIIAPIIPRLDRPRAVAITLPIAIIAQVVSAFYGNYYTLMLARSLSGAANGVLLSVATAEGADATEPDRAFAGASVITMCISIVKSPLLGYAKQLFGFKGVFLALGGYDLCVGIPLLVLLIASPRRAHRSRLEAKGNSLSMLPAAGVLLVMGAYSLATGGVSAFVERVATHAGITASALGRGFSLTALAATLGGWAAARVGLRWGRAAPTLGGLIVIGGLSHFVMAATSISGFWVAWVPWAIVYWFSYTYIMGLSVLVDPLGRLATVTSAVLIAMGAAGAGVAGVMTERTGLASFGWAACSICVLGAFFASLVLRSQPR